MGLGDFISKAYDVGVGYDKAYDQQRTYRARQLETEQLNRNEAIRQVELEKMKALRAQEAAPAPQVGQYDVGQVPVMPVLPVPEAETMPQPTGPTPPGAAQTLPQPTGPTPPGAAQTLPQPTVSEVARFQALTPAQKMAELKRINAERQVGSDRGELLHYPARALDVFAGPINATLGVLEKGANAVGVPRLGKALGIYDPEVTRVEIPKIGDGGIDPYFNEFVRKPYEAGKPIDEAGYLKLLKEKDAKAPKAAAPKAGKGKDVITPEMLAGAYNGLTAEQLADAQQLAESNNNPNAVSKKGATGLMQVRPSTAMDPGYGLPNVFDYAASNGVPFAARTENEAIKLLKNPQIGRGYGVAYMDAMLKKYNGNTLYALAGYNYGPGNTDKWLKNGGNINALPEETRKYIPRVLNGVAINGQAAGAPAATPAAAQPQSPALAMVSGTPEKPGLSERRKMKPSDFYLGGNEPGTDRISADAQRLQAQYQTNRDLALGDYRAAVAMGDIAGARAAERQVRTLDAGYADGVSLLKGMDAIRKFENFNDPRYLSAMISDVSPGNNYRFQPYEDGDYEVIVVAADGRESRKGKYSMQQVIDLAKDFYDEAWRSAKIAQQKETAKELAKSAGEIAKEEVKNLGAIQKAIVEGNLRARDEMIKLLEFTVSKDPEGNTVMYRKDGSEAGFITPGGVVKDSEGRDIKTPGAYTRVTGLK